MVMGLASVRDLAMAIAAGRVPGEPHFNLLVREEYTYRFSIPSTAGAPTNLLCEAKVLKPFAEYFWSGFDKVYSTLR